MNDVNNANKVWVVIPAAGVGKRMQSDLPKQYLKINDETVLQHTLNCFSKHVDIEGIIVALHEDDPYWNSSKVDVKSKKLYTVEGGAERSDSVLNALTYLSLIEQVSDQTWVLVHDAARPCLLHKDLDALLQIRLNNQSKELVGGILATPVRDTMKRSQSGNALISKTENREDLWHALTPQLFRLGELSDALKHCIDKELVITDEASALEAQGKFPILVEGSSSNIKITQAADLELATWFLSKKSNAKNANSVDVNDV